MKRVIKCSYDEEHPYDTDYFRYIEQSVLDDLGLYVDWSAVRGNQGTIWIFSDPNHENNADMWMGDLGEALVRLDFYDYLTDLDSEVFRYPEELWKETYQNYILRLLELSQG